MPDVNYIITIKTEGDTESTPKSVASNSGGEDIQEKQPGGFSDFTKSTKVARNVATMYALKYADLAVTTKINRVELRTGNSTLQQRISYEYSMSKSIALSSMAIIGGALTKNPVAVIAGVASLADIGIQAKIAQENINIARQVEGVGLEMANIRAGANGGRSGKS